MMNSSVHVKLPNSPPDIKLQIANCAQTDISEVTALVRQILKGSNSSDLLSQVHRTFATSDFSIANTADSFHKLSALATHLGYQEEAIERSVRLTETVTEQLNSIKLLRPR